MNFLEDRDRRTLEAVCDALVPREAMPNDPEGFWNRDATDLGIPDDVARIVETYLSPRKRDGFRSLLRAFDSPWTNLLLGGDPSRFTRLTPARRERYLLAWARSSLGVKRRGFQAAKRLVLFLFYAKVLGDGLNPNWRVIGYEPPSDSARDAPDSVRLSPLRPDRETSLETDVCVVGSGAGGAVIAARLARAGFRVLVLEAGPYRTSRDFSQREGPTYDDMFEEHGLLTTRDLAINVLAGRTAGGSTTINWMTSLDPPPWARDEWERDAGMADVATPLFDAFLDEVKARLHVTTAESQENPSNAAIRRGCEALGYRPGIDFDVIPRNALGCATRCDFCFFGCVYDAKQSTLVTYLPDAGDAGARFLFSTQAERVTVSEGMATGVEATYRGDGKDVPVHIRARAVVAAGGAVQTPALLWRSGVRFRGVGRGLRLDPTTVLVAEYDRPIRIWSGPMQTLVVRRFQDADDGHHGPWIESAPGHPGLAALAIPWTGGRSRKEAMSRIERSAASIVLVRDVGEGIVRTDARGEPILEYRLSSRDRRNLIVGLRAAARIHQAAGALRISTLHESEFSIGDGRSPVPRAALDSFESEIARRGIRENAVALFSAHPMGSARAGRDPRTSAAKPTGECHEVRNLWIGDGSLLPTAPGVNPMISIMALAARTATYVEARLRM